MSNSKRRIAVVALIAVALVGSLWIAGRSSSSPSAAAPEPPAPAVKLVSPRAVQIVPHEELTGTLYPEKALQVGFEVAGRLQKVKVRKGEKVAEGQLLGQLDPEVADAQVAQAEAALAAAEAASAIASDVAQRHERLLQQGSVSDMQQKTASSNARQAQAQVLAAKAALAQARAARKRHDLKAPFAATVISAPEQVGATMSAGTSLFTLEKIDTLVLKATIPEAARGAVKPGGKVKVSSVSGDAVTDNARVRVVILSADSATRRVPVEITVPNGDNRFVAYSLVKAVLPTGEARPAQGLPATALSSTGGDHVFVLVAGQTKQVAVEVLERGASEVVVRSATPLAQVIDYPSATLSEGTKVSVK